MREGQIIASGERHARNRGCRRASPNDRWMKGVDLREDLVDKRNRSRPLVLHVGLRLGLSLGGASNGHLTPLGRMHRQRVRFPLRKSSESAGLVILCYGLCLTIITGEAAAPRSDVCFWLDQIGLGGHRAEVGVAKVAPDGNRRRRISRHTNLRRVIERWNGPGRIPRHPACG